MYSKVHVADALPPLVEAANEDGRLSLETFKRVFSASFLPLQSNIEWARTEVLLNKLFQVFDAVRLPAHTTLLSPLSDNQSLTLYPPTCVDAQDKDGMVDTFEMVSGLAILCGGTRDEMATAAFQLYDANGDGLVKFDEMRRYLVSVFRVSLIALAVARSGVWPQLQQQRAHAWMLQIMFALQPSKRTEVGMTPEELAETTTRQCFQDAEAGPDEALTLEQFRSWYTAPGSEDIKGQVAMGAELTRLTLEDMRQVTGLVNCEPEEVMAAFEVAFDEHGDLTRPAFLSTLQKVVQAFGPDPSQVGVCVSMCVRVCATACMWCRYAHDEWRCRST